MVAFRCLSDTGQHEVMIVFTRGMFYDEKSFLPSAASAMNVIELSHQRLNTLHQRGPGC